MSQNTSQWIGTTNHRYAQRAQEEVRRLMPGVSFTYLEPLEVFIIDSPLSREETLQHILNHEPIFLRHIQPIDAAFAIHTDQSEIEALEIEALQNYLNETASFLDGKRVAVQARISPEMTYRLSLAELREATLAALHNVNSVLQHADWIISIYVSNATLYVGISKPTDNLSDWTGGAIRFRKEPQHISRAKFKLLEAEIAFSLDYSQYHHALDVGAAPGGWTSLLLERGVKVTAVDPAALHPSLKHHPQLTYYRKNVSEVSFAPHAFDLLVCDMSWSPRQTARLLLDLVDALTIGGTAIITLKLMHKNAFQAVREMTATLEPHLQLLKAKQLFHNRDEITLCFLRSDE